MCTFFTACENFSSILMHACVNVGPVCVLDCLTNPNFRTWGEKKLINSYFLGWCWSRRGCYSGRTQPLCGPGPGPHSACPSWAPRCGQSSFGLSWCGRWPHPGPAKPNAQRRVKKCLKNILITQHPLNHIIHIHRLPSTRFVAHAVSNKSHCTDGERQREARIDGELLSVGTTPQQT